MLRAARQLLQGRHLYVRIQPANVYTTETGKINYAWTITGGTITSGGTATDNTATVTWNVAGTKSITVNYSDPGGCGAATPTVYNVTVNPQPTVVTHDPAAYVHRQQLI